MKPLTTSEFIEKAIEVHGNKYDYSKIEYINAKTKVKIICPIHGEFEQKADSHLQGNGCCDCGIIKRSKNKTFTTSKFIKKAIEVHGNKYDYSKVEYKGINNLITIICPIHGEFEQKPIVHLRKHGCQLCSNNLKLDIETFINKAIKVHGNKYDYSKVDYINSSTKVKIICPIHGEFEQEANSHLHGSGCYDCGLLKQVKKRTMLKENFIKKANKIYNNKYDYSKMHYIDYYTKVKIICPIHGEFEQTPNLHINNSYGCSLCGYSALLKLKTSNQIDVINKANKIHNNKYDYSKVEYLHAKSKIKIICPIHGEFEQTPDSHLNDKQGCPKCSHHISSYEEEICQFLEENNIEYIQSDRKLIKPFELDIIVPEYNLAIEFNGLYWHSEQMLKNRKMPHYLYHKTKVNECKKQGYHLLTIFENEWNNNNGKEIIKSIILNKCHKLVNKIHARKCIIKQIESNIANNFYNENHIQGQSLGNHYGLVYNNELISLITFNKYKNDYNLSRFVNKKNIIINGAFSKLLKYFIKNNKFDKIFTFADNRYFSGNVYLKNGFKFVHEVEPSYYYFQIGKNELYHKRNFQHQYLKNKLKNYDPTLTEYQNMLNHGYDRIWDCGKLKFEYINKKTNIKT